MRLFLIRSVVLACLAARAWSAPSLANAASGAQTVPIAPVVVGSKPFGESYLLAEMFAQLLMAREIPATLRHGLGGTEIIFPALERGDIDLYPEYTGSGLLVILKAPQMSDSTAVYDVVSREFARRYDMRWLPPLGFENTYAMSVRTELAERLGLRTLSDVARLGPMLRAGFTADFIGLPDGLPGLRRAYGLSFDDVRALAPAIKYQALAAGQIDIIDAYSTDGLLARYPLTVLVDDRGFFPPYDAAILARGSLVRARPEVVTVLSELSGRLDVTRMRALNERVEVRGEAAADVARDALRDLGLITSQPNQSPELSRATTRQSGFLAYLWARRAAIGAMTVRHVWLVAVSLALAALVAIPLGLGLERTRGAETIVRGVGVLQTVPGIALLAFMLPVVGIGVTPAIIALFLYSLYPIVRNTYTGVRHADAGAVEAARALGMTPGQVLRYVRLPLAAPVIVAGVRTAAVLNVGTATLAAFIGGGGLGDPIVSGLALADTWMVLSGALPAAVLAVVVDAALGRIQHAVSASTTSPES